MNARRRLADVVGGCALRVSQSDGRTGEVPDAVAAAGQQINRVFGLGLGKCEGRNPVQHVRPLSRKFRGQGLGARD